MLAFPVVLPIDLSSLTNVQFVACDKLLVRLGSNEMKSDFTLLLFITIGDAITTYVALQRNTHKWATLGICIFCCIACSLRPHDNFSSLDDVISTYSRWVRVLKLSASAVSPVWMFLLLVDLSGIAILFLYGHRNNIL